MEKCKEKIMSGFHLKQCSRNASIDGYCKQHHPDNVEARQEKSRKEYEAKWNNSPIKRLERAVATISQLEKDKAELVDAVQWASDNAGKMTFMGTREYLKPILAQHTPPDHKENKSGS